MTDYLKDSLSFILYHCSFNGLMLEIQETALYNYKEISG